MSLRLFLASAAVGLSMSMTAMAQVNAGGGAAPAAAAAASDDPVSQAITAFQAESKRISGDSTLGARERYDAINKAASDTIGALKIEEMSIDGFEKLADQRLLARVTGDVQKRVDERLVTLAKDGGVDGARAAMARATFTPAPTSQDEAGWKAYQVETKARVMGAMTHSGLPKAVETGKAKWLFGGGAVDGDLADAAYCDALSKVVNMPLAPETVARLWSAYLPLADDGATATPEAREKLRMACSDKVAKALGVPSEAGADASKDRTRKMLEDQKKNFEGAYAKGKLVGFTAPDIEFGWSNVPGGAKKLSDLKGKVVVVDFWAVWCGPCVASFPQVRDLQARYKDYPVVVLGVTDMQGTPRPQAEPGKQVEWIAEKQYPALDAWAKEKDMTWPIAVGTGNVFNPEYGVMGIPHVVIIDPEGKVRYRGLHPASEPAKKHEHIDGLLKEFKLPHPEA